METRNESNAFMDKFTLEYTNNQLRITKKFKEQFILPDNFLAFFSFADNRVD